MREHTLRWTVSALCCCFLTACSAVQSYPVGDVAGKNFSQKGGVYYLPKHILRVAISSDKKAYISTVAVPDGGAIETGLALSGFSDDTITVKTTAAGFLEEIDATLVDRTGDILIEAAKIIARFRSAPPPTATIVQDMYFDPFDSRRALAVNGALRASGYCVEVELRPNIWSPGCSRGSLGSHESTLPIATPAPASLKPGVYYRRATPLMVHVVKDGRTAELAPYAFANGEPIFQVDIRRSIFVTRKTKVTFTDGALTSVYVDKPSEVLAGVRLPIAIVDAFANALTAGQAQSRSALYQAQANKENSSAALIDVTTQQMAAGDASSGNAGLSLVRDALVGGGFRTAPMSPATLRECQNMAFTPEQCRLFMGQN